MVSPFGARLKIGLFLLVCTAFISFAQPKTGGYAGKMDGVRSWQLPNAPSTTRPDQAWHSVGSSPDGDIYISGHDHATNSMLYRLSQKDDTLRWVGDARTASQAANNWENGETCQKFHVRPIYYNGKVYVASLDRSTLDNAYQSTRGFHWYAYDIVKNTFSDLSASEANGVGVQQIQLVTIQADPKKNVMYGISIPQCKLVSYDIDKKVTTMLNRPSQWSSQNYIYSDRFFFVDSRSRVYISAGNERSQWYQGENKNVFNKMFYYDPASSFGELTNFPLQGANSIEVGQWTRDHAKCYMSSDMGHLYCFTDAGATWTYLGRPNFDAGYKVWSIWVSPDGEKLYVGRCDNTNAIFEFDIATKTSRQICTVAEVDNQAGSTAFMTGYDTWDRNGNLYVADFSMNDGRNVILTRINPVRIKVAKGLLPELVQVTVAAAGDQLTITRTGSTTSALKVIYQVDGMNNDGVILQSTFGEVTIAAGQASVALATNTVQKPNAAGITNTVFSVESDGNEYINGSQHTATLSTITERKSFVVNQISRSSMQIVRNQHGSPTVQLTVAQQAPVTLVLYDLNGKRIKTLVNKSLSPGTHLLPLQNNGTPLQGLFIAAATIGTKHFSQKVMCY